MPQFPQWLFDTMDAQSTNSFSPFIQPPYLGNGLKQLSDRSFFGIKKGLHNIRTILEALGDPDRHFPLILIGGTNGKGSTGSIIAYAGRAAGLKIGWTTSPHLRHPRERIWIDGQFIADVDLDRILENIFDKEKKLNITLTYFELIIASALQSFFEERVDLAIVEVGMGGRWDATNATDPVLSVITNVGMDHQQYLGDTRELIGREKLAIARSHRPLILGPSLTRDWVEPLLENAPTLYFASSLETRAQIFWNYSLVDGQKYGLAGRHQLDNLACAQAAIEQLRKMGFKFPSRICEKSLGQLHWPGRLSPLPGFSNVWLDGAHNAEGLEAIRQHCVTTGMAPHLYFGVMKDKDLPTMVETLKRFPHQSLTLIQGKADRFAAQDDLSRLFTHHGLEHITLPSWDGLASRLEAHQGGPVLVLGSLYLLGEILEHFNLIPNPE